ncbi:MAG: hypothetical protein ACR2LX_00205 [Jatrophihabitans sp.]
MGRHSAPGVADDDAPSGAAAPDLNPRPGRHAQDGESSRSPGAALRPGPKPVTAAPDPPPPTAATKPKPPRIVRQPSLADLPGRDEPVPEAVTEQIPTVPSDDAAPTRPGKPVPKPKRDLAREDAKDDDAAKDGSTTKTAAAEAATSPAGAQGRTDLALLKTHGDVRARVVAAVIVPFVLYVGVLLAIGSIGWRVLLIWIWVPLVTGGVLAGLFLDAGHRTHDQLTPAEVRDRQQHEQG